MKHDPFLLKVFSFDVFMVDVFFPPPPGHPNIENLKRPLNPKKSHLNPLFRRVSPFFRKQFPDHVSLSPPPAPARQKPPGVWESLDRRKSSFASSRPEVFSWQKWCPKRPRWEIFFFLHRYPFSHNHRSVENHPKWKDTHIGGTHFPLNHDYGRKGKSF